MYLDLLALTACIVWALVVAYTDLLTFRISNFSLVVGLLLIWPSLFLLDQRFQLTLGFLVLSIAAFVAGLASWAGMGDAKLVIFAAPWLHYETLNKTLIVLLAVSWAQLIVLSLMHRAFPKRIAFAPAILLAGALNMAT
jgi:Flp pilus assembly protein protease CpaA